MLAFTPLFCYGVVSHMQKGDVFVSVKKFPVIDLAATGENIRRLRLERGMSVRDLQSYFGFEEPRAIYKWQKGESLPTVDNLYALGSLLEVPLEKILIPVTTQPNSMNEQQAEPCCSSCFLAVMWLLILEFRTLYNQIIDHVGWDVMEPVVHFGHFLPGDMESLQVWR